MGRSPSASALGLSWRTREARRRTSMGRTKAAVLPDPVFAMPSTSRPLSAAGSACAWMAVGLSYLTVTKEGRVVGVHGGGGAGTTNKERG